LRHRDRATTTASADRYMPIPTPHDVGSLMAGTQLSQGNARDLRAVSVGSTRRRSVQVPGITTLGLPAYPHTPASSLILIVAPLSPRLTRSMQLPSDPGSLRTPLPFGYHFPLPGVEGTLTPKSPTHHHVGADSASQDAARHAWRTQKKGGPAGPPRNSLPLPGIGVGPMAHPAHLEVSRTSAHCVSMMV